MNTFLKKLLAILFVIALGILGYLYFGTDTFKSRLSPQDTVTFKMNDLELEVFYNRPSKRGREIFGALVPFDEVWRTGANEATTFKTNQKLIIKGKSLPAGNYTLWSIPNDTLWTVIFNSKQYPWGVDETMKPMRIEEYDVLNVLVKPKEIDDSIEQFTIGFDNSTSKVFLTLAWDNTKIEIPIEQ